MKWVYVVLILIVVLVIGKWVEENRTPSNEMQVIRGEAEITVTGR
jgi:hypothetical protein